MPILSRRSVMFALPVLMVSARAWAQQDWSGRPLQLLMVSSPYCHFCRAWQAEIGPGFAVSAAGRTAPLFEVDVAGPFPDGLALDRRPRITPSFILLDRGIEIGRVEGYVGQRYFYPVLEEMFDRAGVKVPAGS